MGNSVLSVSVNHLCYLFLMACLPYISATICHMDGNIQLIPGYRCYADRQVYLYSKMTPIHPFSCRYSCIMNAHCSFVEFNVIENSCLLATGPCLWLEPHTDYQTMFIRTKSGDQCIKWLPRGKVKNAARKINSCTPWNIACTVGRLHMSSNILPGNGVMGKAVFSVLNGIVAKKGHKKFLDVQPGCKVSWVSYTGGDPIPTGAVQGGSLQSNGGSQPIYVMGVIKNGSSCATYGYYNPATGRGYFEYWGVHECTQMYLMIIEDI